MPEQRSFVKRVNHNVATVRTLHILTSCGRGGYKLWTETHNRLNSKALYTRKSSEKQLPETSEAVASMGRELAPALKAMTITHDIHCESSQCCKSRSKSHRMRISEGGIGVSVVLSRPTLSVIRVACRALASCRRRR